MQKPQTRPLVPYALSDTNRLPEFSPNDAIIEQAQLSGMVMQQQRSPLVAFLLAALLGPLGFTYTNLIGGLLAIILAIATLWTIFVPIVIWILCALFAPLIVMSYNKSVRTQKKYVDKKHEEIIQAIRSVNLRAKSGADKSKPL